MDSDKRKPRTHRSTSLGPTIERPLEQICPSCRTLVIAGRAYCSECGADLDAEPPERAERPERADRSIQSGTLIDNRYRIVETLGEGGMGAVFRVEHVRMGKIMALKILRRELLVDARFVERFEQEAQIVSRLSHPNTVSVFDFGELADHGLYMAMEYVPGKDLRTLLDENGAFPEARAVGVAIQILNSLAEAHDAGIIHRDIKPPNVMLMRTREGGDFVKVVDFGIAKLANLRNGGRHITDAGSRHLIGTPEYVSPEQARGERLDARSDLYSLASLLFELTTNEPLFDGPTAMAIVSKHLTEPPPALAEVAPHAGLSAEFEGILHKALAKDPADRYQSADEMRRALTELAESASGKVAVSVPSLSGSITIDQTIAQRADWDRFEKGLQRSRRVRTFLTVGIGGLLLVGLVTAATAAVLHHRHAARAAAPVAEEHEPNNSLDEANPIATGKPIRGTIGPRLSDVDSDVDFFTFDVPQPSSVRIDLTAVPNVNLAVELLARGTGDKWRALAKVDDQPLDSALPEVLDDVPLAPGRYAVSIRDQIRHSETHVVRPRENSTDRYTLTVKLVAPAPLGEVEPDNTFDEAHAVPATARLSAARPVVGHAGGFAVRDSGHGVSAALWSDDHFAVAASPSAHQVCALLFGVAGVRLQLQLSGAAPAAPVTAGAGEIVARCVAARAPDLLSAHVSVESGAQYDAPYLLTLVDDGVNGTEGLQRAADWLTGNGRAADARELSRRALAELARAVTPARPRR